MIYHFEALDKNGDNVSDHIDASSDIDARKKIRSKGLYLVKIEKHVVVDSAENGKKISRLKFAFERFTEFISIRFISKQVGLFSRQLATLLSAGLPLPLAISNILEQIDNKYFKGIIADVKDKIQEGSSFSNALNRHKKFFSEMYINMVRVGENLGSLDHVVERLADMEEKKNVMKNKIQAALYYPVFMFVFAIIVVIFLMIKVIPSISQMFIDQKKDLPLPTKVVIFFSNILTKFWFLIPIILIVSFYLYRRYAGTEEGKRKIDEIKLSLPLVKNLYKKIIVFRFTQNFGILISNKVDIIKSFEIVEKIVDNRIIEEKIAEAEKLVREGSSISNALKKTDFLPKMVMGMIAAGESSDNLDKMMLNIGRVYETEIELTITSLTNMLEPVIIVFMGLIIGTIVMAVMLPMMEMNLLVQ